MKSKVAEPTVAQALLTKWRDAVPNDRLAHLIKDATRGLTRALHIRLQRHGVSFGHWVFLRVLWERDGLMQRELSDAAGMTEPTTFSALIAMEKQGYIERRKLPHNAKNVYVYLTPQGRALRELLVPLAEEVNAIGVAGLDAKAIAGARKLLLKIIENLAEDEVARAQSTP